MTASLKVEKLVLGLGLSGLGTLWLLSNLGRLDLLETLHRWWPSLLVVWGLLELAESARARGTRRLP
jgi:hypothetical protein